jgi:hypothetical protein
MESRISNLLGVARHKLGSEQDTNVQIQLEQKTKPLIERNNLIEIINQQELADEERQASFKYRFNGKLNIYTANEISSASTSYVFGKFLDTAWSPMFKGAAKIPPNWVMQISYPSKMDFNYQIKAKTNNGNYLSEAYRGLQYTALVKDGENLTINGIQTHNLTEGDYIYLYSNDFYNPLQGIHRVNNVGIEGENLKKDLVLNTITNTAPSGYGNFIRIVDPSFNDLNFNDSLEILNTQTTDINGSTSGTYQINDTIYLTITTIQPHYLLTNDFVDIRVTNISKLNGVWRVHNIVDNYKFVIKTSIYTSTQQPNKGVLTSFSNPRPRYRRLDGYPSEYYVRKFEVLTSNDYEVYPASFSTNIYPDVIDNKIGVANDTWMFQFNQDVDFNGLVDHRNGPISEICYSIIRRAGQIPYPFSDVTADWEFNSLVANYTDYLEVISKVQQSNAGTIEKSKARVSQFDVNTGEITSINGDEYIVDFVEYNSIELSEKVISDIIHRFGNDNQPNSEGYYYKPFKKLEIRTYSNNIETAGPEDIVVDLPGNYVTYADGSIAWRDLLTIGYFEENTNGVDYPFTNGAHYFYFNHNLYVRRQIPIETIDFSRLRVRQPEGEEC